MRRQRPPARVDRRRADRGRTRPATAQRSVALSAPVPQLPELREELLDMTARELAAADAFFARCAAEPALDAELERRLAGPVTPLITALDAWEEAPPEATLAAGGQRGQRRRASPRSIEEIGAWPGLRLVGADGADAAWMLAQHADRANELRRRWLPLLRGGGRDRRRGPAPPGVADRPDRGGRRASSRCTARSCCSPRMVRSSIRCRSPTRRGWRSAVARSGSPDRGRGAVPGRGRPHPVRAGSRLGAGQPVADGGGGARLGRGQPRGRRAARASHLGDATG